MVAVAVAPPIIRLTPKQETFCLRYSEGSMNTTEAAISAGYSPRTARVIGYENLLKPYISARIAELRQMAVDASIAGKTERQQVLTEIVRGRLANFVGKGATSENLKSAALQEITITGEGITKTTKVKLHPIATAIDLLNKMDGLYHDGAQVNIDNRQQNINIQVTSEAARNMTQAVIDGAGTG